VEAFDISQSNSEHSRHWFFKGRYVVIVVMSPHLASDLTMRSSPSTARLVIDGKEVEESLMDLVIRTLEANPNNSLIAFRYMTCAHSTVRFWRVAT
jgi:phosphoribosylformylglycinamidine synthase